MPIGKSPTKPTIESAPSGGGGATALLVAAVVVGMLWLTTSGKLLRRSR